MRLGLIAVLAALPLAACSDTSEPASEPEPTEAVANAGPPETAPAVTTSPAPGATPEPLTIPAAVQGRWALTEADCTSTRGATGLLEVGPEKLTFYESVASVGDIEEVSANRIRADFDFTGEGMTWERNIALEVQDGGQTLVRREYGEGAAPDPFRYTKCP